MMVGETRSEQLKTKLLSRPQARCHRLMTVLSQVSGLFGEGLERWCGAWDLLLGWATGGNWQVLGGDHFAAEA